MKCACDNRDDAGQSRASTFFTSVRAIALAAAMLAWPHSGQSAERTPDFSFSSKAVKITVRLDPRIKAEPGLAASCLSDGKQWAARSRADAEKMKKGSPLSFSGGRWTFDRTYTLGPVIGKRYVNVMQFDRIFVGGNHNSGGSSVTLWDRATRKRTDIRPFLTETNDDGPTMKAIQSAVIASLIEEKKRRGAYRAEDRFWESYDYLKASLAKIGPTLLAPSTEQDKSSGLNFYYAAGAISTPSEPEYIAFVPWETLKPYLSPEGAKIFGGARPKGDGDGRQ